LKTLGIIGGIAPESTIVARCFAVAVAPPIIWHRATERSIDQ